MKTLPRTDRDTDHLANDSRWQLVHRVVDSPLFAKSERLSSFLLFICRLSLEGRDTEINEQTVGETVFGRPSGYDPTIDGIVRTHAHRLRQRLEQFFSQASEADEPLVLTIPRGAYIPVFSLRERPEDDAADRTDDEDSTKEDTLLIQNLLDDAKHRKTTASQSKNPSVGHAFLRGFLGLCVLWMLVTCVFCATHTDVFARVHEMLSEESHPLWKRLFRGDQRTLVIVADSGIVMLQNLTNNRISLADYASGSYRDKLTSDSPLPLAALQDIGSRRYTSYIDLQTVTRLLGLPGVTPDRIELRYARDLRADDLKDRNAILIGSYEATPWIQMYEPRMNFYFSNNLRTGVFSIINRSPRGSEKSNYDFDRADDEHKVYGLIAFQPSLSGSNDVLILEGQTMAGTEAATDFVFNESYLRPFLAKIKRPDGSIPHFEVLVGSKGLNGDASHIEVLTYRVE